MVIFSTAAILQKRTNHYGKVSSFMKIDMAAVADRLTRLREYHNLSKKDFAASVGIDASSYTKIEKAEKPLKADMAYAIAERWGVSMDYLYRGRLTELPRKMADALMAARTKGDR